MGLLQVNDAEAGDDLRPQVEVVGSCSRRDVSLSPKRGALFRVIIAVLWVSVAGCRAHFHETHYFASVSSQNAEEHASNYFRLKVDGTIRASKGRYVSGYYDERAVDLLFNEIKPEDGKPAGIPKLFHEKLKDPGSNEVIRPLSPDDQHGALVLILSTDATSVANAIGSFAQSEAVADSIVTLLNRDTVARFRQMTAEQTTQAAAAKATHDELVSLFDKVDSGDRRKLEQSYVRILNAIANSLEPGTHLESIDEARVWFANPRRK